MSAATTTTPEQPPDDADELGYELGRYRVDGTERVLYGRRVNGAAIVIDAPAGTDGRVYLVERDVDQDGYPALRALVDDYIAKAQAMRQIPMATGHRTLSHREPHRDRITAALLDA